MAGFTDCDYTLLFTLLERRLGSAVGPWAVKERLEWGNAWEYGVEDFLTD